MGAAVLGFIAVLLRGWAAPAFERLPSDYMAEVSYLGYARTHQTPSAPEEIIESIINRHERVLTSTDQHLILQGDLHWVTPAGVVIFETRHLYGIDRDSRQNLPGYGDQNRYGQFLFPPRTQKSQYVLWDPNYAGPAHLRFDRIAQFHGLDVYVFNSVVNDIDETSGFSTLPGVPNKYHVRTDGVGRIWVEPRSGVVVDHEDRGVSHFVNAKTDRRIGVPVIQWSQRYTSETVDAQVRRAGATRLGMLALQIWLPLTLACAALIVLLLGRRRRVRVLP